LAHPLVDQSKTVIVSNYRPRDGLIANGFNKNAVLSGVSHRALRARLIT